MANVKSRQHLLFGKRYGKLLVWTANLSADKSKAVFRRDLRDK